MKAMNPLPNRSRNLLDAFGGSLTMQPKKSPVSEGCSECCIGFSPTLDNDGGHLGNATLAVRNFHPSINIKVVPSSVGGSNDVSRFAFNEMKDSWKISF